MNATEASYRGWRDRLTHLLGTDAPLHRLPVTFLVGARDTLQAGGGNESETYATVLEAEIRARAERRTS